MSQQVDIYYDPDTGEMTVKIDGLPDQQCLDLTKFLKGALGMTDEKGASDWGSIAPNRSLG